MEATGSFDCDLPTADDFWTEPVISSSAGVCFPRLPILRSAKTPNTRVIATAKLSRVLKRKVSHGTAKRFRIGRAPKPEGASHIFGPQGNRVFTMLPLNGSLETGDLRGFLEKGVGLPAHGRLGEYATFDVGRSLVPPLGSWACATATS
jgi:hypothetical protein